MGTVAMFLWGLCGSLRVRGKREPWVTDYSPMATARVTHVAQCFVFGAVMPDAAMLDAVLELVRVECVAV
jgi:hypothetical protein